MAATASLFFSLLAGTALAQETRSRSGDTTGKATYARLNADCRTVASGSGERGVRPVSYDILPFEMVVTGDYQITVDYTGFDGYVHIYDDRFSPVDPKTGCLAADDDFNGIASSRIDSIRLEKNRTYLMVVSSFGENAAGPYTATFVGPGITFFAGFNAFSPSAVNGLWFDPSLDGSGFNIIVGETASVITFYGYIDGVQRWLISDIIPTPDFNLFDTFTVDMLIGESGSLSNPTPGGNLSTFGTLEFRLLNCEGSAFEASATLRGTSGSFAGIVQSYSLVQLLRGFGRGCNGLVFVP
jgi:hypothetical protein